MPCLDFSFALLRSQRPADFIYCNISSTSDLVSCNNLTTKLMLSDVYLNWLRVYFLIGTLPYKL